MTRLQQSRRHNIGYVYNPQVNNDVGIVNYQRNTSDGPLMNPITVDTHVKTHEQMSGEGFTDIMRSIYNKGTEGAQFLYKHKGAIVDAYGSEIGNTIRNALPNSDDTGRPGFAGEKHAILKLPNGKYGVGNYIGPGTQIIQRLKRGDPASTPKPKHGFSSYVTCIMFLNKKTHNLLATC